MKQSDAMLIIGGVSYILIILAMMYVLGPLYHNQEKITANQKVLYNIISDDCAIPPEPELQFHEKELQDFSLIAERFAKVHNYSIDEYNCVNYSNDFVVVATHLGFDVETDWGCEINATKSCHQWVKLRLDMEPQTGEFRNYLGEYVR